MRFVMKVLFVGFLLAFLRAWVPDVWAADAQVGYQIEIQGFKTYARYTKFLEDLNHKLPGNALIRETRIARKSIRVQIRTEVGKEEFEQTLAGSLAAATDEGAGKVEPQEERTYLVRME
jgi:hypothetical protein